MSTSKIIKLGKFYISSFKSFLDINIHCYQYISKKMKNLSDEMLQQFLLIQLISDLEYNFGKYWLAIATVKLNEDTIRDNI